MFCFYYIYHQITCSQVMILRAQIYAVADKSVYISAAIITFIIMFSFYFIYHQITCSQITKPPGTFIAGEAAYNSGNVTGDRFRRLVTHERSCFFLFFGYFGIGALVCGILKSRSKWSIFLLNIL